MKEELTLHEALKNREYKVLFDRLNLQPLAISKYEDVKSVIYDLKEQHVWYMEIDIFSLIVSVDISNILFTWDDSDKQFRLNCEKQVDDNMLLRSITVEN